jgi:hypothetical protein
MIMQSEAQFKPGVSYRLYSFLRLLFPCSNGDQPQRMLGYRDQMNQFAFCIIWLLDRIGKERKEMSVKARVRVRLNKRRMNHDAGVSARSMNCVFAMTAHRLSAIIAMIMTSTT